MTPVEEAKESVKTDWGVATVGGDVRGFRVVKFRQIASEE